MVQSAWVKTPALLASSDDHRPIAAAAVASYALKWPMGYLTRARQSRVAEHTQCVNHTHQAG